jgi:hypothetical protein
MKALAKKTEDRYKRVMDFALALEKAAEPMRQPAMVYQAVSTPPAQPSVSHPPVAYPGPNPQSSPGAVGPVRQQLQQQMKPSQTQVVPEPAASVQQPIRLGQSPDPQAPRPWWQEDQTAFDDGSRTVRESTLNKGRITTKLDPADVFVQDLLGSLRAVLRPIQKVLVTDDYFLRTYRNRRFFFLDILLNLLLTLPVLFFSGVWLWLIAILLSYWFLWYCSLAVKKPVAILSGAGIALWWGYAVSSLIERGFSTLGVGFWSFWIVMLLGMAIHLSYVMNRIKG